MIGLIIGSILYAIFVQPFKTLKCKLFKHKFSEWVNNDEPWVRNRSDFVKRYRSCLCCHICEKEYYDGETRIDYNSIWNNHE